MKQSLYSTVCLAVALLVTANASGQSRPTDKDPASGRAKTRTKTSARPQSRGRGKTTAGPRKTLPKRRGGRPTSSSRPRSGQAKRTAKRMLRVYYLKQAQAETVTQIIAQMMDGKDLRVAMNTRTNSIVVLASAELHKSLETIVQQLDGTPDPGLEVKIFQLQYIKPTDSLLKILTAAANDTKGPKITLGLDTPANRIIARGPRHSLAMLEAMLRHIDTRSARTEHHFNRQSFLVRIAWLSNSKSFATKKGSYPTDFLPVLKEIQRTGVTAPTMISQLFITTAVNQDFTVSGKTKSQDGLVQVQVSGELLMGTKTDDKGKQKTYSTPLLRVQVKTTRGKKDGKGDDDVDLKTTILAPIGSYSVLGLSPGTDGSNLFVIRIDPK